MSLIRVVIADDHPRVREGLRNAIEDVERLALVGEAVDGRDLAAQLAAHRPDVVVTDLGMPHFDLPQQHIADWRASYPTMKILVHTAYKSAALARLLIDVGADTVGGFAGPEDCVLEPVSTDLLPAESCAYACPSQADSPEDDRPAPGYK